jgi:hypothetical protein
MDITCLMRANPAVDVLTDVAVEAQNLVIGRPTVITQPPAHCVAAAYPGLASPLVPVIVDVVKGEKLVLSFAAASAFAAVDRQGVVPEFAPAASGRLVGARFAHVSTADHPQVVPGNHVILRTNAPH